MRASNKLKCLAVLVTIFNSLPVSAQSVIQSDVAEIQAQIRRGENGFASCGVRAVVLVSGPKVVDIYDFSLVLDARGPYGLLKAGKMIDTKENILNGKVSSNAVTPSPLKFWIVPERKGKVIEPIKIIPAESKGFILVTSDPVQTYESILAIIHSERMHFAARYKSQRVESVIAFSANMSDQERATLMTCLDDVVDQITKLE